MTVHLQWSQKIHYSVPLGYNGLGVCLVSKVSRESIISSCKFKHKKASLETLYLHSNKTKHTFPKIKFFQ